MQKRILVFITFIVMIFSSLSGLSVAAEKYDVTYEEDFEYGETDIKPSAKNGSSEIIEEDGNHFLRFKGNDVGYSMSPFGPYVADYDFSVKVRQNSYGGQKRWSKILLHSEWGEGETYQINLYNYRMTATYEKQTKKTTLAEKSNVEFTDNVWHTLNIFSRGDTCTVYLNKKKILTFTSDLKPEGCFGFVTWQTDFEVDDISIIEYPDGAAPAVESIMPPEVESTDRQVIEKKRDTREMKEKIIQVSNAVTGEIILKKILIFAGFLVATVSAVAIALLFFLKLRKKNKNQRGVFRN